MIVMQDATGVCGYHAPTVYLLYGSFDINFRIMYDIIMERHAIASVSVSANDLLFSKICHTNFLIMTKCIR